MKRPADISGYPEAACSDNTIKYNIQTNFSLFETYLKQCKKLKLLVVSEKSKEIIGHVEINNLLEHITKIQLQKYFPIVTTSSTRIGDLRVDFDLSMNSLPEATKKTRKRSRKKTKLASNSFRSAVEEEKLNKLKKGCKACPNHIKNFKKSSTENLLNIEMPESPKANQPPPNKGNSDYVLLDVLEKSKKLRDAMVLSVLEDSDIPVDINEEMLLKFDHNIDSDNKSTYKSTSTTMKGELVTPHEEKLISNYLEGKAMKEEEEKLVLTTLHPAGSEQKEINPQKQESCRDIPKNLGHRASGSFASEASPLVTGKSIDSVMKKINCFRLTVDSLTLTPAGWRKVSQAAVDNKIKSGDMVPPPGATYFVECHFVEDTPRSQAQQWKVAPLRFCSRRQIEDVVYFGQSSAHSLKPPHSVSELESVNCLVCWRHLHQRVPALLGSFQLAPLVNGSLEAEDTLPVISDNVVVVGHIKLRLQLGKDKLYFGNTLLDDLPRESQFEKKIPSDIDANKPPPPKGTHCLNIRDLESKHVPVVSCKNNGHGQNSEDNRLKESYNSTQYTVPFRDVPLRTCTNCGQNMLFMDVKAPANASLCVSCSSLLGQHQKCLDTNFKIAIPSTHISTTRERRHHEFLLGIDTVTGFPLFANVQEELSFYVDYKFPQITSGFKAEMCSTETTSRVVDVESQPSLASVHRHSLALPVVLPISPLLAACSPGITLRLWLRYYKPTPRDHMVAMALLPMDELCLMELEFDERQQEIAISKVLELPLALVPSSVTAPYQKCPSAGTLRVSLTYSNFISPPPKLVTNPPPPETTEMHKNVNPPTKSDQKPEHNSSVQQELKPISVLLDTISGQNNYPVNLGEENRQLERNRFWIGPLGKENVKRSNHVTNSQKPLRKNEDLVLNSIAKSESLTKIDSGSSRPVMKEDLDILAESIEHKFNQLQSDLLKEKQRGLAEISVLASDAKKINGSFNGEHNEDFLSCHSPLSSNSSMESLPFILNPPADFKDIQNIVTRSDCVFSKSTSEKSVSDTISGFLKEEKNIANYGSNDPIDKNGCKPENTKSKTFKAMVKIDRAVNLKAVKAPSNGKKGKVPPSSWISFGIGDCCEQNCTAEGPVCARPRFTTPVIRRNHNPIWNLSWDIDLPVEYLQKEEKRLVFSVFEEQLGLCVGRASASVAILRSGLPCLSTWLSIDDLQGACRGQLKVVVTPLEDLRHYQNCSVYDTEEDDFDELKEKRPDYEFSGNHSHKAPDFVASQTEVFLNDNECASLMDVRVQNMNDPNNAAATEREDHFLADDIINDYKNTLENNFRNEMAGLENLIKFLRVGSVSSELSFFRSTENKENLSSNPTPQYFGGEPRISGTLDSYSNVTHIKNTTIIHQPLNHNSQKERSLVDAATETVDKGGAHFTSTHQSTEDILSKLLHQISTFQPSVIKVSDNISQTKTPETKESFTETSDSDSQWKPEAMTPVCMKDASTETEDIAGKRCHQANGENTSHHLCEELGNVLLQHFLTCKPIPVKVTDSTTQTVNHDGQSTVNSSGVFMSGISVDTDRDNFSLPLRQSGKPEWNKVEAPISCDRLAMIDSDIKDLEQLLKQNPIQDAEHSSASLGTSVDEDRRSSSDVESLESYCQTMVFPRETPDGGDPFTVLDLPNPSNSDKTETSLRRQGTFVIEKSTENSEHPKENPCQDTV